MKHRPRIESYCLALTRAMCRKGVDLDVAVEIVDEVFNLDNFDKDYIFAST